MDNSIPSDSNNGIDSNNDVDDVMLIYLKNILQLLTISLDYINTTITINNNIMTYDISNTSSISNSSSNSSNNSTISIKVIKVFDNLIIIHGNNSSSNTITTLRLDPQEYLFDSSYILNDIINVINTNDINIIKKFITTICSSSSTYNLIIKLKCHLLQPLLLLNDEYACLSYLSSYLVENILSYMSSIELVSFGETCQSFQCYSNAKHLWKDLLQNAKFKCLPNTSFKKSFIHLYKQKKAEEKNRLHRHFVAYGQAPLTPFGLPSNVPWIVGHNGGGFMGSGNEQIFVGNPRFRMNLNDLTAPLSARRVPHHRFDF
jgi:hypothetical protein